jgi:taurine dioxygenase
MRIERLTNTIGAEVLELDLRQPISSLIRAELKRAWLDHLVLVVREQEIDVAQHIAFASVFGTIDSDSAITAFSHPDHKEIFVLTNETKDGKPSETRDVGWQWHTDLTYTLCPSAGAVLHAQAVPDAGGDTMFSNMYRALETLSPAYRDLLRGLECVHDVSNGAWYRKRAENAPQNFISRTRPVLQPMIRQHPETGRELLQIGEAVVRRIHGMTSEESASILHLLTEHSTRPENVMRHRWRRGDLLIWDNRCTMHKVVADHSDIVPPGTPGQVRRMHRVTLKGIPSGRLLEEDESLRAA